MQFAGQRTDENFNPIGEPQNWLVQLTDEILPDPDAVLITGITPQKTLEEGYSEAEFLKLFYEQVCQPDTVLVGFNTIRFDDEFMRATLWRNFYDPYEWHWQDGRSRWDLLDVTRIVRALRPEGIKWPFQPARAKNLSEHGKLVAPKKDHEDKNNLVPSNRLELLTKVNGLDHQNAHDALNDVMATIAVAKLLKQKQPKIFQYLFEIRGKKRIGDLMQLEDPKPFIYCSGKYSNKWLKTTAVMPIAAMAGGGVLVYDLRQNPQDLIKFTDEELMLKAFSRDDMTQILPIKLLRVNCCPAVAPLGVLDEASQKRLNLSLDLIKENHNKLKAAKGFGERLGRLYEKMQTERQKKYTKGLDADFQMYDGFVDEADKTKMRAVRAATENQLANLDVNFKDQRLNSLLLRYKARNFSRSLNANERETWEEYRSNRIVHGAKGQLSLQAYAERLGELANVKTDDQSQFLLQELQLYAESIAPMIVE